MCYIELMIDVEHQIQNVTSTKLKRVVVFLNCISLFQALGLLGKSENAGRASEERTSGEEGEEGEPVRIYLTTLFHPLFR